MKRLWLLVIPLALAAALYLIANGRGGSHKLVPVPGAGSAKSSTPHVEAQPAPPTTTSAGGAVPPTAPPHPNTAGGPVITAPRTNCQWRRYTDGAIASDPSCAPGALNPAVVGHTAQTICNTTWLAAAASERPPPQTLDELFIEYSLPGPPALYAVAQVIPVQDGGSPTSPSNLYPLPLDGWGGVQTQASVAEKLHQEICANQITLQQAAQTLTGDWLATGVENND